MSTIFETRLAAHRHDVERYLAELIEAEAGSEAPSRLADASRHALLGGGKRFRPFLVMESAGLFGVAGAPVLAVAAALEMVHCYSLVHDDLPAMDNDRFRRGQPTVWAKYDEWTAILAGDHLLTLAFEVLSRPVAGLGPDRQIALVAELAAAAGGRGMIGGQVLDLMAEKLGDPAVPDAAHISAIQRLKTGALIVFACRSGAVIAGAAADDVDRLGRYGDALGLAFQISDDLLDATGDAEVVGKAVAKDAALGKATLVSLYGVDRTRQMLDEAVAAAHQSLSAFGARAAVLAAAADYMRTRRS
ncbi:MAG TPA: polyprenyl synthetase family protein [Hyphomicrobiaceae bacterium]|nr:polyprenyl synthetase family protein [Hyphomicrobiaceae bacterium]